MLDDVLGTDEEDGVPVPLIVPEVLLGPLPDILPRLGLDIVLRVLIEDPLIAFVVPLAPVVGP